MQSIDCKIYDLAKRCTSYAPMCIVETSAIPNAYRQGLIAKTCAMCCNTIQHYFIVKQIKVMDDFPFCFFLENWLRYPRVNSARLRRQNGIWMFHNALLPQRSWHLPRRCPDNCVTGLETHQGIGSFTYSLLMSYPLCMTFWSKFSSFGTSSWNILMKMARRHLKKTRPIAFFYICSIHQSIGPSVHRSHMS